ncbi:ABC transporter ATP-binding protein [Gammaproteobacteria bacterium LSUCC0057]|uniref:ABC transporter ATP-binding protein n=1 Tax=Gammaproteobacteria bacterium LSUCC0057 TaxID=2559237 RepID=A0A4Y8UK02_9GAMM|nr:ABC transporter ATP-binding protein [Gammaproteobacteria bacterium LSUCC0057]
MQPALAIEQLSKQYQNGFHALKGVSFTVAQGDFFALLGPNGAGKSTTIGIISSLVRKTAGAVKVFGIDVDSDFSAAKQLIGVVPQEFNFSQFEKPIDILVHQAGYYGIPQRQALQSAERYLKQLGLWERRSQPARNLSGGMKRRLMIARALMHSPKLLILDEPTAGVDIELRRSMWEFLEQINRDGTTIILTTHYLEEAESLCRNIAIIDQGNIVENTSMKALLKKLNKEHFILDISEPLQVAPQVAGYPITLLDEHSLEVEVEKQRALNTLFAALGEQGVNVVSMRNKSNRLEELFLSLVDASLESRAGSGL